jgi:hypothetical protein
MLFAVFKQFFINYLTSFAFDDEMIAAARHYFVSVWAVDRFVVGDDLGR